MSTTIFAPSVDANINSYKSKSKVKKVCNPHCLVYHFQVAICLVYSSYIALLVERTYCAYSISNYSSIKKNNCTAPSPPSGHPEWNASDYLSNYDYYRNFDSAHEFTQADNLRMDRLSWPRFRPGDVSKVIYLRKQYHMPDLKGSSTTLHWADMSLPISPRPIQLTRTIWGINDQQVRINKT